MEYPPELQWAVREAKLMDDPQFQLQLREFRCSPLRLLDYMERSGRAKGALELYDRTEGYTKSWSCNEFGFVKKSC